MALLTEERPGIDWSKLAQGSDGTSLPPFSSSSSSLQSVVDVIPKQKSEAQSKDESKKSPAFNHSRHESQGLIARVKNALKSKNIASTIMTTVFIKAWFEKTVGEWGFASPLPKGGLFSMPDKINKVVFGPEFDKKNLSFKDSKKPGNFLEKTFATLVTSAFLQNIAFLGTMRGGKLPEGDTIGARVVNSLKHPDKHSVHFSTATMCTLVALMGITRTTISLQKLHGIKKESQSIDFKSDAVKGNVSSLVAGIASLVCSPLIFFGAFKIKKDIDKPAPDKNVRESKHLAEAERFAHGKHPDHQLGFFESLQPKNMIAIAKYAWEHDKVGLLGRGLQVLLEAAWLMKGRSDLNQNPANAAAYNTVKGSMTGIIMSGFVQPHFVYSRLWADAQKKQSATVSR